MTPAEAAARVLLGLAGLYAGAGLAFAIPFVLRGVDRIDPGADGAGWGFRVLALPGSVLFWPLLLRRLIAGARTPPSERNAHDRSARSA